MKVLAPTILAVIITSVIAMPNPWPAPTAAIDQRDAKPMYCVVDGHGTRCMPDKSKRTAAPIPIVEGREPKHHPHSRTTTTLPNGCSAFITGQQTVTRCEATTPQCTTFVGDDGTTTAACVLKRNAAPEPTLEARLAEPEAEPMYCMTDAQGTRCMPNRRAAATLTPDPATTGWFTSGDALCSVSAQLTRCLPNKPRCTTYYDNQTASRVECVL